MFSSTVFSQIAIHLSDFKTIQRFSCVLGKSALNFGSAVRTHQEMNAEYNRVEISSDCEMPEGLKSNLFRKARFDEFNTQIRILTATRNPFSRSCC